MQKLIKIIGGNASGKSTRLMQYVDRMGDFYQEVWYEWNSVTAKHPEGKMKKINSGRLYNTGVFIMGKTTKTGNWVGTDYVLGGLGNKKAFYEFLRWLETNYQISTVIAEGYFALGGGLFTLSAMQEQGLFDEVHTYAFLYDSAQDYLDRTNARSGKSVTEADWEAKGSIPPGWGSNVSWNKQLASGKLAEDATVLKVLDPMTTPREYFIEEF